MDLSPDLSPSCIDPNPLQAQHTMLKKFGFGRDTPPVKAARAPATDLGATAQNLRKLREMVRVAVKGTLNQHGMGAAWVGCEVALASEQRQAGGPADALTIRLIVQVWREDLLRYLPALQKKIIESLARVEPGFDHSHHVFSWEFAPDCGCTVVELPPAAAWRTNPLARSDAGAHKPSKPRFDLPPSDFDLMRDERDDIPSIFSATQTGFLATEVGGLPKTNK